MGYIYAVKLVDTVGSLKAATAHYEIVELGGSREPKVKIRR